jgi:hypothetical protein
MVEVGVRSAVCSEQVVDASTTEDEGESPSSGCNLRVRVEPHANDAPDWKHAAQDPRRQAAVALGELWGVKAGQVHDLASS